MEILGKEYSEFKHVNNKRREFLKWQDKINKALHEIFDILNIQVNDEIKSYFIDEGVLFEYENSVDGRFIWIDWGLINTEISKKVNKVPYRYKSSIYSDKNYFTYHTDESTMQTITDFIVKYLDIYDFTVIPLIYPIYKKEIK